MFADDPADIMLRKNQTGLILKRPLAQNEETVLEFGIQDVFNFSRRIGWIFSTEGVYLPKETLLLRPMTDPRLTTKLFGKSIVSAFCSIKAGAMFKLYDGEATSFTFEVESGIDLSCSFTLRVAYIYVDSSTGNGEYGSWGIRLGCLF